MASSDAEARRDACATRNAQESKRPYQSRGGSSETTAVKCAGAGSRCRGAGAFRRLAAAVLGGGGRGGVGGRHQAQTATAKFAGAGRGQCGCAQLAKGASASLNYNAIIVPRLVLAQFTGAAATGGGLGSDPSLGC